MITTMGNDRERFPWLVCPMGNGKCYRCNAGVATTLSRYFGKNSKKNLVNSNFAVKEPVNYDYDYSLLLIMVLYHR